MKKDNLPLNKGLFKETTNIQQPKGTWDFALNSLIGSWYGEGATVTNEHGNEVCYNLPSGDYTLIGAELLPDNDVVVFLTDNTTSIIGVHDTSNCTFTSYVVSNCLGFKKHLQINALTRIIGGCKRKVYFTDRVTSYKAVNLDDLDIYLANGFSSAEDANLDPDNGWNCKKFDHFLSYLTGCVKSATVLNSGGSLQTGAHEFAIRYLDKNLNPTNWSPLTNPIYIYSESTSGDTYTIDGEAPQSQANLNTVNKSILFELVDLDTTFSYVQLAVAEFTEGNNNVATNVFILDEKPIPNSGTLNYLYQGFNPATHITATIGNITIPTIPFKAVQAHTQIDNRLLLANIETTSENWASLQRATLLGKMKWASYNQVERSTIGVTDNSNASVNPDILFTDKTWTTDEVYAFGVVFLFENGEVSPTFHLPGRPANLEYTTNTDLSTLNLSQHLYQSHVTPANEWDTELLTVVPDAEIYSRADRSGVVGESNVRHIPDSEFVNCSGPQYTISPADTLTLQTAVGVAPEIIEFTIPGLAAGDQVLLRVTSFDDSKNDLLVRDELLAPFTSASPTQTFNAGVSGGADEIVVRIWVSKNNSTYAYPEHTTRFLRSSVPTSILVNLIETENKHLGCQIPRWKMYNTYVVTDRNVSEEEGYMGYHQNDSCLYPENMIDCQGNSIWDATSIGGSNLTNTPIRHHRMPDIAREYANVLCSTEYEPSTGLQDKKKITITKLGIKVDMTDVYANIPVEIRDRIIGHYITMAERTPQERTVVDKGFMWENSDLTSSDFWVDTITDQVRPISPDVHNTHDYAIGEYVSPELIWNNRVLAADYMKFERFNTARLESPEDFDEKAIKLIERHSSGSNHHVSVVVYHENYNLDNFINVVPNPTNYIPVQGTHRNLKSVNLVPYNSVGSSDFNIGSLSPILLSSENGGQKTAFYQADRAIPNVYRGNTPSNSSYKALSDTITTAYESDSLAIGYCTSYVSLKNYKEVYCSLGDLTYYSFHNCYIKKDADPNDLIKGGDTFITRMRAVKTKAERTGSNVALDYEGGAALLIAMVESSDINGSLAHAERESSLYAPKNFSFAYYLNFYRGSNLTGASSDGDTFNYQTLNGAPAEPDDLITYGEYTFDYNENFGKHQSEVPYFPLSDTYDFCNKCEGKEASNIYYSERSFSEERIDNYKLILVNNSFPIPNESGEITNLFIEKDQLYAHTWKALWNIQVRPQQLESNEATVFIGTGGLGSIPPVRLVSTEYGYAGSIDPFATISTQYGTFFIDSSVGRVFNFSQKGLNEISRVGMNKWFKENGVVFFRKQFYELTGIDYPVRDTSSVNSVGFQSVYEPRMDRIILHKKDYKLLDTTLDGNSINFGGVYYTNPIEDQEPLPATGDLNTIYVEIDEDSYATWFYWDSNFIEINLNDANWFRNEGWTLSFDLNQNTWASFHSYQPNFMYNDNSFFFSFINENADPRRVWKHNERNYQTYYGVKYPHIIQVDMAENGIQEKVFQAIQYISNVYLHDAATDWEVEKENITFDQFYVYNNNQISSLRDLIVKEPNSYQGVTLPLNQTLVDSTDNYWRFNRFRDERIDYSLPIHTKDWAILNTTYNTVGQGYIDKIPNPLAIDVNKNIYKQARLRDKNISLRLFFNPEEDYRIVTEVMSFLNNNSLR